GERGRRELAGHGVDCAHVRLTDGARLGAYFLEYGVAPRPIRVLYDRRDSAFARLTPAEVDWTTVRQARLVHLTGITPALSASARALSERALAEAAAVSFDLNYRAALWSPSDARAGAAHVACFLCAATRGADRAETVDTATAVAALKCSIWGDIAVITPRDVDDVLAGGPGVRR